MHLWSSDARTRPKFFHTKSRKLEVTQAPAHVDMEPGIFFRFPNINLPVCTRVSGTIDSYAGTAPTVFRKYLRFIASYVNGAHR